MAISIAFGVLLFGVPSQGDACSGEPCGTEFILEEVREVRHPHGSYLREASGLTRFGGHLWIVSDKHDTTLFRLNLSRPERVLTVLEVPLDVPPPIRQAVRGCGAPRGERLDLEDIATDAEGHFFLLSENYRAILIVRVRDALTASPRAAVETVLCIPGKNRTPNDGPEGLAAAPGTLLVIDEGKGHPDRDLYRCLLSERRCLPVSLPLRIGRTPGLTVRDPDGPRLFVLNTWPGPGAPFHRICEVRLGEPASSPCILDLDQAKARAKDRPDFPEVFRRDGGTNYEGMYFDSETGRLYVINDNNAAWNRMVFGDADREPTLLLIFTPSGPARVP